MPTKKRIYISGKISGMEEKAFELFEEAEMLLHTYGYEVINPMKLPHNHDKQWHSYMREDIKALCECDAIYMLRNWKDSRGAQIEFELANYLEIDIIHQHHNIAA